MDRTQNPYAPGAGYQPPELAGRDVLLRDAQIDLQRIRDGKPTKSLMLLGLRGVGKTVLLNRLHTIAVDLLFQAIKIEAPEGGQLARLMVPEIRRILHGLDLLLATKAALKRSFGILRNFVKAFKISVGDVDFGIELTPGEGDTGDIEQDVPVLLLSVARVAKEANTAVALFIDEVQYLSPSELSAIIVACHQAAQMGLPLFFVGAGLPQIAALAGNAKSYAERLFDYPEIGPLDPEAARRALVAPARRAGVEYGEDAADSILAITERYPYFIQEWGFHVWNYAEVTPISAADVEATQAAIIRHLDANFFRVRFDRLTALQQKYLRAMAELGKGPFKTGDIAAILEVEATTVAPVRKQLIDKGMVWTQRHGETAFTVPLFDAFMRRQMPVFERHIPKRRSRSPSLEPHS
ncbi:MAG: AAA family ATPase [Methylobacterium sp.]|nr:AAA family ATPase [Methylobacterium sp.]